MRPVTDVNEPNPWVRAERGECEMPAKKAAKKPAKKAAKKK